MIGTSLKMPPERRCAFCDYLAGTRPFSFVYRGSDIAVMVTREQRGDPHILVIPIRHAETILDVSADEIAKISVAVHQVARAIHDVYSPRGISIWQNNGIPANQKIRHFHFHIAGTLPEGGTNWGEVPELDLTVTDSIAARLRPHFASFSS